MDITYIIIELLLMILLFFVAGLSEKYVSNKWRLLYAAPTFLAIVMVVFEGFDIHHIGLYLAVALQIVCLFMEKKGIKRILATSSAVMLVITFCIVSFAPSYHREHYYKDFIEAYDTMKAHYVLTEEKGIDWDKLYDEYEPLFKEVDKTQDFVENYKLWQRFTGEFYDGHVGYQMSSEGLARMSFCQSYGNDYGLSLARLSTGEYVAVNVEGYENSYTITSTEHDDMGLFSLKENYMPENTESFRLTLKNAGIKNGTVITKWNGRSVDECLNDINYYIQQYPVRENEDFYKPVYAAGIGKNLEYGDTYVSWGDSLTDKSGNVISDNPSVDITFIDDSGEEKTVSAPNLGSYFPRMYDTLKKLNDGVNITNLNWQEINKDTYMIRISEMIYDQATYSGSDFSEMTDKLRKEVLALKEAGVKNIVFDLRANSGGSPYFVEGIACLFAPEGEHLTYYNAVINESTATYERGEDGKYKMGVPSYYTGEDIWHDGKIILLVNASTVSAGDDMTYMMGDFPNVTVMGITRSNSSCQAVTQVGLENGSVGFSAVPNLLPSGEVAIDTFTDHVGRTPFDEKIPFDKKLITAIFDNGEDYILQYAIDSF